MPSVHTTRNETRTSTISEQQPTTKEVRHVKAHKYNTPMSGIQSLAHAACVTAKLPTSNVETQLDSTKRCRPLVTQDNVESQQQCSTSSSTPTTTTPKTWEGGCNRRIVNVDGVTSKVCGKKPVVFNSTKQHYCEDHNDERKAAKRVNYHNKELKKKEETTKVPSSMSLLCAVSEDGFFLDVFPGSHRKSYFKHNSKSNPIHFSAAERIHVPQTYMILFHKFLFHCGSAVPENNKEDRAQHRLFAYVTTQFINEHEREYNRLISTNRSSDIPDPSGVVSRDPYEFCCPQMTDNWLCDNCDKEKVLSRENIMKDKKIKTSATKEWDRTVPGSVVAGNMKKLGYVIVRTSLTKQECPYLLAMETSMKDWENISSKGMQPCESAKREQFAIEKSSKKAIAEIFKIPFDKLRDDILIMDRSLSRSGYWTQGFAHKKMLRNIGPCPKQYPHADYNFKLVRLEEKETKGKRKQP